jgi:hypothetical protein
LSIAGRIHILRHNANICHIFPRKNLRNPINEEPTDFGNDKTRQVPPHVYWGRAGEACGAV